MTATAGDRRVTLGWTADAEPDLAGYNVYRGTGGTASGPPLNAAILTSPSYVDTSVTNGTTYTYVVEAVDTTANRAAAASVSATPQPPSSTPVDLKVNFQNETGTVPTGYLRDFGEAYGARSGANQGSGLSYGWVVPGSSTPLSLIGNGRDRNAVSDQRLDTLMHMQGNDVANFNGIAKPGAWEISIPNGTYTVTVSVGDASTVDSVHRINLEAQPAITRYVPTAGTAAFARATRTVTVADGRLTVDATGGTNTKVDYLDVATTQNAVSRPSVTKTTPADGATDVFRDAAVTAEVRLPNVGAGVDTSTLTSTSVRLIRLSDNQLIPAELNTSGGGDVIVLQPTAPLDANTTFRFEVNENLKDVSGAPFLPWTSMFTTGSTLSAGGVGSVAFDKVALSTATGKSFTSVVIGPDGKLYAGTLEGEIDRFPLNTDGTTGAAEVLTSLQQANGGPRQLIGMTFDPAATAANPILWVTHGYYAFSDAPDWSGKVTRLSGPTLATVQDYVVGLPRSIRDHETNSLAFGPDGKLYILQGSNSAMGAPDSAWGNRAEHLLNAALLRLDPALVTSPPLDVKTEAGGTYDPFAPGAPLTLYATGLRNAWDLVWHSNGRLYVPTNGSAAGGNTPATPSTLPAACSRRIDSGTNGAYTGPAGARVDQRPGCAAGSPLPRRAGRLLRPPQPESLRMDDERRQPDRRRRSDRGLAVPRGVTPDRNWRGAPSISGCTTPPTESSSTTATSSAATSRASCSSRATAPETTSSSSPPAGRTETSSRPNPVRRA